jgi:hypothetical protein
MKKLFLFSIMILLSIISYSQSMIGYWCITTPDETLDFIQFNQNGSIIELICVNNKWKMIKGNYIQYDKEVSIGLKTKFTQIYNVSFQDSDGMILSKKDEYIILDRLDQQQIIFFEKIKIKCDKPQINNQNKNIITTVKKKYSKDYILEKIRYWENHIKNAQQNLDLQEKLIKKGKGSKTSIKQLQDNIKKYFSYKQEWELKLKEKNQI